MTVGGSPTRLWKEARALLPSWLMVVVAIAAARVIDPRPFSTLVAAAYLVGVVGLGALSMGHEYTHRTLSLLLSQPVRRSRVLIEKLLVLVLFVATLAVLTWLVTYWTADLPPIVLLPALLAICVAPCLAMLSRHALAGWVFTLAVPAVLLIASESAGVVDDGVMRWGLLGCSAIGAIVLWRAFSRLEAIDGPRRSLPFARWLGGSTSSATSRRRHPIWLVVKKELRLQQLAFVVAALYVLAWLVIWLRQSVPQELYAMTLLYASLLPVLIGSTASAEERQSGTIESQVLLPMSATMQWSLKAGVALGLMLMLGVALPFLLVQLGGGGIDLQGTEEMVAAMVAMTGCALYVSSVSTSTMRAILFSPAVAFGAVLLFVAIAPPLGRGMFDLFRQLFGGTASLSPSSARVAREVIQLTLVVYSACCLMVVLRFAGRNHRHTDRGIHAVPRQALWMALLVVGGVTVFAALSAAFSSGMLKT